MTLSNLFDERFKKLRLEKSFQMPLEFIHSIDLLKHQNVKVSWNFQSPQKTLLTKHYGLD
jgi:hypothetical protein